ncbi:hypothetical protein [Tritonibacter mobilis]|uniref:hypothetical protein n=1 Tax=Tritonibacter mobilis TaxID=379347 RepID=UPI000F7D7DE8|nr:hypothetical protein [Tritonibacter mobilis]
MSGNAYARPGSGKYLSGSIAAEARGVAVVVMRMPMLDPATMAARTSYGLRALCFADWAVTGMRGHAVVI